MQIPTVTKPVLRARILDHVDSQLSNQGYRGMRVDDIARDVGISKRTLYELFRTKQEMAIEALARRFAWLDQELAKLAAGPGSETERLREIIIALARVHGDGRSALARDLASAPVLNELVRASRVRCNELVDRILRQGIERGRFRAGLDVALTRRTLLMAIEGMIGSQVFGEGSASIEPAVTAVFDVFVGGIEHTDASASTPVLTATTASLKLASS